MSNKELLDVMIKHINLEVEEKGEYTGVRELRTHLSYYVKGLRNATEIRNIINKIEHKDELIAVLREYFANNMNI